MAEVVKKKKQTEKYEIDFSKNEAKKNNKNQIKKSNTKKNTSKSNSSNKQSLWAKFRVFCHGVKCEAKRVHWTGKSDMVKYSISTISFIIFCALFFYLIYVLFAFVQALFA